jgi:hypothetical protein
LVLTLADDAYPRGTSNDFRTQYDPYWGTLKAMTEPTPGNHEYETRNAAGDRDYFGYSTTEPVWSAPKGFPPGGSPP